MIKKLGSVALALTVLLQPAAPFAAELIGPLELPASAPRTPIAEPLAPLTPGLSAEQSLTLPSLPGGVSASLAPLAASEAASASVEAQPANAAQTAQAALSSTARTITAAKSQDARSSSADHTVGFVASQELFDGRAMVHAGPVMPSFEPPTGERMGPPSDGDGGNGGASATTSATTASAPG